MSDQIFYRDYSIPEVEQLARAIAVKRGLDPDALVAETGYPGARKIPRWWQYQDDAFNFIAMSEAGALVSAGFVIVPKSRIKEIAYEKIRLWEKTRDFGDSENTPANWIAEALIKETPQEPKP